MSYLVGFEDGKERPSVIINTQHFDSCPCTFGKQHGQTQYYAMVVQVLWVIGPDQTIKYRGDFILTEYHIAKLSDDVATKYGDSYLALMPRSESDDGSSLDGVFYDLEDMLSDEPTREDVGGTVHVGDGRVTYVSPDFNPDVMLLLEEQVFSKLNF